MLSNLLLEQWPRCPVIRTGLLQNRLWFAFRVLPVV